MDFYKDFNLIRHSNSDWTEYHGAGNYSSYKKKKLIENHRIGIEELQEKYSIVRHEILHLNLKIESVSFDVCTHFLDEFYLLNLNQEQGYLKYLKAFKKLEQLQKILFAIRNQIFPLKMKIDLAEREIERERLFFLADFPE